MPTPRKIPLTIISGFLGSGKTSLLNHLLTQADGRRITLSLIHISEPTRPY